MLQKQQYESVWSELQKFSGALMLFYVTCFFMAYYLKRNGADDHFLVGIYDALLFKQITLGLFAFFALSTLRLYFLPKRVKSDAAVIAVMIVLIAAIL